ncbi:hypothetical protein HDR63_01675 [bacterium]|nr:hypothetical protein [bacterium]
MRREGGNFLLQALLAVTLLFAFMPLVVRRMAARDQDAQMYAVTRQLNTAQTAARIFIQENAAALPYGTTVIAGNTFADTLEAYGLPLGFVPRTALGQAISLVIERERGTVAAYLNVTDDNLPEIRRAELARRLGFYAATHDNGVTLAIPLTPEYSDVVHRDETDPDNNGFLVDLDMGDFSVDTVALTLARNGTFDSLAANSLTVAGMENGRKVRSTINNLTATRATFQSGDGTTALSVTRGVLRVDNASAKTIAQFGDTGNLVASVAAVYDFNMTAGRTSFTGPESWTVNGNVLADRINFSVDSLEIGGYINASRGQDVYINPDSLEYNTRSGIEVGVLRTSNVTLRDQTSDALADGDSGPVMVDIRPAGTSVLPDVLVDDVDNGTLEILADPRGDDGRTVDCRSIISNLGMTYNQRSLAQYLVCQYVYWHRLEQRIDMKQCLLDGRHDC